MQKIHFTTAMKILDSRDPVDLAVWKTDGSVMRMENCVSLRRDFYQGTRNVKAVKSGQIRRIRDCCLFEINGMEVFL